MKKTGVSKWAWGATVSFLFLCCFSIELSRASPTGLKLLRKPVTYLSGKVPLPSLSIEKKDGYGAAAPGSSLRSSAGSGVESDEAEEEEEEEDYYEDVDIYGFSHFWHNMIDYAYALADETNSSLTAELSQVKDQVEDLKTSISERDEEVASLREELERLAEETRKPVLGDVRLIHQQEGINQTSGVLLFYAGERIEWGYVCDDMFYSAAASVACRQLGYSTGEVDVGQDYFIVGPQDPSYPIVLDDVQCSAGSVDLLSCEHLPVGVHNCGQTEAVKVKCLH